MSAAVENAIRLIEELARKNFNLHVHSCRLCGEIDVRDMEKRPLDPMRHKRPTNEYDQCRVEKAIERLKALAEENSK